MYSIGPGAGSTIASAGGEGATPETDAGDTTETRRARRKERCSQVADLCFDFFSPSPMSRIFAPTKWPLRRTRVVRLPLFRANFVAGFSRWTLYAVASTLDFLRRSERGPDSRRDPGNECSAPKIAQANSGGLRVLPASAQGHLVAPKKTLRECRENIFDAGAPKWTPSFSASILDSPRRCGSFLDGSTVPLHRIREAEIEFRSTCDISGAPESTIAPQNSRRISCADSGTPSIDFGAPEWKVGIPKSSQGALHRSAASLRSFWNRCILAGAPKWTQKFPAISQETLHSRRVFCDDLRYFPGAT